MALEKARVQLLNPDTGAVITEVDILTTGSCVSYVNENATVSDFRGIPAGTTFKEGDNISVSDILDKILYPYEEMEIESVSNAEGKSVSSDTIYYQEKFKTIPSFTFSSKVKVGNIDTLTFTLKRYNNKTGDVKDYTSTIKVVAGSEYLYTQEVKDISDDTSLQLVVTDGTTNIASPTVEFKFIYPMYVGYCDINLLLTTYEDTHIAIDPHKASEYFNNLIATDSFLIDKRIIPEQDLHNIIINDPLITQNRYYPFILYPNEWSKIINIFDCNEDIITGSFHYNNELSIKPDNDSVHASQYTVYACKESYNPQLTAAGYITFQFEYGKPSIDYKGKGVPNLTGFNLLNNLPLDLRLEVEKYSDLEEIEYKYDGMVVFVDEYSSYYRYDQKHDLWFSTNQEMLFGNTVPPLELGKDGDTYINLSSGHIYQKYKNIRWEDKGVITVNLSGDILLSIDVWQRGHRYKAGEYVYWNGKYWKALFDTTFEPGTDNTWVETKPTVTQGPQGEPGEAATVEIADVLVTDNDSDANVINLGDKFHARLRFIIPKGEKGAKGDKGDSADIIQFQKEIKELQEKVIELNNKIPTVATADGNTLYFKNDLNQILMKVSISGLGIPIMENGKLNHVDSKSVYLEKVENERYYDIKFMDNK